MCRAVKSSCSLGGGLWGWEQLMKARPSSASLLTKTGPKGNCQFTPALHHQEDDGGVASSPSPTSSVRRVSSLCSAGGVWRFSDKQWHASPAVLTLGLGAQPCVKQEKTLKTSFYAWVGQILHRLDSLRREGRKKRYKMGVGWGRKVLLICLETITFEFWLPS